METAMTQKPCITQKQSPLLHQNLIQVLSSGFQVCPELEGLRREDVTAVQLVETSE
ncbi:hypothetical protein D4764_0222130, partial [Takifugu flavidus]